MSFYSAWLRSLGNETYFLLFIPFLHIMSVTPAAAAAAAAVAGVDGILRSVDVTSDATPKAWQACSGLRSTCFTATVKGRWGSPAAGRTILE